VARTARQRRPQPRPRAGAAGAFTEYRDFSRRATAVVSAPSAGGRLVSATSQRPEADTPARSLHTQARSWLNRVDGPSTQTAPPGGQAVTAPSRILATGERAGVTLHPISRMTLIPLVLTIALPGCRHAEWPHARPSRNGGRVT
jgi:hypothetical protein